MPKLWIPACAGMTDVGVRKDTEILTRKVDSTEMGKLTFILGGARSGKSALAQRLASERAGEHVLYIATLRETAEVQADAEMQTRITRHRANRPAAWQTLVLGEEPIRDIADALNPSADKPLVLLDCLSMFISGQLFMSEALPMNAEDDALMLAGSLVQLQRESATDWIVVSNEVGLSVVPESAIGRLYRDALGRANQVMAGAADEVYWVVAGLVQQLKPASVHQ